MRIRTTVLAALTAGLLLTGCSSAEPDADTKPTPATEPSETTSADYAAVYEACVEAIAADIEAEVRPTECSPLTDSQFLDANLDGTVRHNEAGREKLREAMEEASRAAED